MSKPAETQLWVPGMHLDDEFPVPSNADLVAAWEEYRTDVPAQALQGVYGVYSKPAQEVKAVASIDLCEVVRDTVGSIHQATGITVEPSGINFYSDGTWFSIPDKGEDYEKSVVWSVARVLMREGHVPPTDHAYAMAAMLRNWRRQGIYTVANTSTLPGCELGTIKHTLGRDMPEAFDALVLPRNHDGNGSVTKAGALTILASEASIDLGSAPFIHIDDAPHHIQGFQAQYPESRVQLFMPRHSANSHLLAELHCDTPFEAFVKADTYFASEGVIDAR